MVIGNKTFRTDQGDVRVSISVEGNPEAVASFLRTAFPKEMIEPLANSRPVPTIQPVQRISIYNIQDSQNTLSNRSKTLLSILAANKIAPKDRDLVTNFFIKNFDQIKIQLPDLVKFYETMVKDLSKEKVNDIRQLYPFGYERGNSNMLLIRLHNILHVTANTTDIKIAKIMAFEAEQSLGM